MIPLQKPRLTVIIIIFILHSLLATAFLKPADLLQAVQISYKIDSPALSLQNFSLPDVSNIFDTPEQLEELIRDADVIIRGRVISQESQWTDEKTDVETDNVIQPLYMVTGSVPDPLIIRTSGGILAGENIGIYDSEAVTFEIGEEVLLFAYAEGSHYRVVREQRGKFLVGRSIAVNEAQRTYSALHMLYSEIKFYLLNQDKLVLLPYNWDEIEPATEEIIIGQDYNYNERQWDIREVKYKVNINTEQASDASDDGSVEDFLNAIVSAGNTWSNVNTSDFILTYDGLTEETETGINGSNDIVFEHRGTEEAVAKARYWFNPNTGIIQEADIWINEDFQWNANGNPEEHELDVQTAVLHEMGHWLALGHDTTEPSVMYFSLAGGITKQNLHANDKEGISFIYPCLQCASDVSAPKSTATGTATSASTATSTPTSRPTSTQRPMATPTVTPTRRPTSTPKPIISPTTDPTLTPTNFPSFTPTNSLPTNSLPTNTPLTKPTVINSMPTKQGSVATAFPIATENLVQSKITPSVEPVETIVQSETVEPTETVEPENLRSDQSYLVDIQAEEGGALWGEVGTLDVHITFPPEAAAESGVLSLEYAVLDTIDGILDSNVELLGPAFNIDVNDENGIPITQFDPPLALELTYGDILSTEALELTIQKGIHLGCWDTQAKKWIIVPSQIDPSIQQITADLDHLTTFAILVGHAHHSYLPIILE